jgi:hypothetical protein
MNEELQKLLQRCSEAQESGRSLVDRQLQLVATRRRLRRHSVAVLEEFTDLARRFFDTAANGYDRD